MSTEINENIKAYAILNRAGAFLLVREKIGAIGGLWGLPGGGIDPHESVEDGLRREVQEELGFLIEPVVRVPITKSRDGDAVRNIFLVEVEKGSIKLNKDELLDARWFTLEEIRKLPLRGQWVLEALEKGADTG